MCSFFHDHIITPNAFQCIYRAHDDPSRAAFGLWSQNTDAWVLYLDIVLCDDDLLEVRTEFVAFPMRNYTEILHRHIHCMTTEDEILRFRHEVINPLLSHCENLENEEKLAMSGDDTDSEHI